MDCNKEWNTYIAYSIYGNTYPNGTYTVPNISISGDTVSCGSTLSPHGVG